MRAILFRAKHIHVEPQNEHFDGTWVYGYLTDKNYINSPELGGELLIDPETVCQYTGLTDKNGKKIFEGDILKQYADTTELGKDLYYFYKIEWNKDYGYFEGIEIYSDETFLFPDLEDCEVIGNIFDNPDLLATSSEVTINE